MRILLVSNNPLSSVENNGKTLLSYFRDWPEAHVFQVWFRPELPNATAALDPEERMSFFQLTDQLVIKRRPGVCHQFSQADLDRLNPESSSGSAELTGMSKIYRSPVRSGATLRLLREIPWFFYPFISKNQALLDALSSFSPDLIFFCAGDSLFAYRITEQLRQFLKVPLVLYVTDDYILPYRSLSPAARFRRFLIRRQLLMTAQRAELFFSIGDKMQQVYKEVYGLASQSLVNISPDHFSPVDYQTKYQAPSCVWQMVYAGGLHYDRDRVLLSLIEAINQVNRKLGRSAFHLDIYALPQLPEKQLAALNSAASSYRGAVSAAELEDINQRADILVFVESDHPAAVRSTALSLSTKVPEYQSYHRAILTIGSDRSASISYLKSYSMYAKPAVQPIYELLLRIADAPELLQGQADRAYRNFTERHRPDRVKAAFREKLSAVKESCKNDCTSI